MTRLDFDHELTTPTEFGIGDAVEVVVAEAELEDARLLQLDGHVGQGDAGADHRPILGGWNRELWDSLQE